MWIQRPVEAALAAEVCSAHAKQMKKRVTESCGACADPRVPPTARASAPDRTVLYPHRSAGGCRNNDNDRLRLSAALCAKPWRSCWKKGGFTLLHR